jgi:hypothetical protein
VLGHHFPMCLQLIVGSGYAVRVLKQPSSSDVLAFIPPVVGAAPVTLPGENIYPAITATAELLLVIISVPL